MDNARYQQMIYKRIHDYMEKWSQTPFVIEKEIYAFLHSLKGTAGSIGLPQLSVLASEKLSSLDMQSEKQWATAEWHDYLAPLLVHVETDQTNHTSMPIIEPVVQTHQQTGEQEFILLIDDDIVFISYMKKILEEQGFSVMVAYNGKRGLELVYEINPTIVFLDVMLPDKSGFHILRNLKSIKKDRMFVAIISANDSDENKIQAYRMGAMDFIAKPIDKDLLIAYVHNRLTYKNELERSVILDELTQTYNRKFMNSQLQKLIKQYERHAELFSIAIVDLDYFKKVNDTYGHLIGDEVLKGFANLVMTLKREQDIFCRYGGEEFVILMPKTNSEGAYILVERLRKAMEVKFFTANNTSFQVTFSAGVAETMAKNLHPQKLLEQADQALYKAKQSGRNQTIVFNYLAEIIKKRVHIKIVVIDDAENIRELVVRYFEKLGLNDEFDVEVMSFADGVSFLQASWYALGSKYIILLDANMPEMDGIEVLKQIRQQYKSRDVIVSILTDREEDELVLQALENGANDYIIKPFDIADVSNKLVNLINRLFV
ncbi:GGDEF domain-containing response regulator [Lysinibacillus piscis]|uniref:Diguanylate cyclase n=1 Tax=Lysinibacillus piscis TaxID=2518931 RepID=A0ABQ5NFW5_9BACI|nr:diguanylate cyclase [Lysinibacillus sp. KH24]GLC87226.1 hypothetical protein LYSBPC_03530 [Lysinibacillus sp. KH24]